MALSAVVLTAALGLLLAGSGFMVMMPAFLCLLPLVAGRYLGESRIERIVRARSIKRILSAKFSLAPERLAGYLTPIRGGRLIAASLAVRPPPAAA